MWFKSAMLFLIFPAIFALSCCRSQITSEPTPSPIRIEMTEEPSQEPSPEPTPTITAIPFATLVGCVYYEDELVHGYFTFKNELGDLPDLDAQAPTGCKTMLIPPGYYDISVSYYQGPVCSNVICGSDLISIELGPNEYIEIDFVVRPRQ